MIFAFDSSKKRIDALYADKKQDYYCPTCNCKVIPRQGEHNIYHFSHLKDCDCIDLWKYDMSLWHRNWQMQFPESRQEIVINNQGEKHRADVLLENKKLVIEFQHSYISSEEFNERNKFYNSCGYKVLWLFDLSEKIENEQIEDCKYDHQYRWKWGSTTFSGFYPPKEKNVSVYFQFNNASFEKNCEVKIIEKFSWCPMGTERISIFRTDEKIRYSPYEFLKSICPEIKKDVSTSNREDEYYLVGDSIYKLDFDLVMMKSENRNLENLKEVIRENIDKKTMWMHCVKLPVINFIGNSNNVFVRYRVKLWLSNDISTVSSECIRELEKSLKVNCREIISLEKYNFYGRSIPEIMRNLNTNGAGLVNIKTGSDFYVSNGDYFKRDKINVVKGRPKMNYGNKYTSFYNEIYRAFKPEWMVKFT